METFIGKLMTCRTADHAMVEFLMELLWIRRERRYSTEQLNAFVRKASDTVAISWPESPHKGTILACLAKLLDGSASEEP